jgi:hypothetical protein
MLPQNSTKRTREITHLVSVLRLSAVFQGWIAILTLLVATPWTETFTSTGGGPTGAANVLRHGKKRHSPSKQRNILVMVTDGVLVESGGVQRVVRLSGPVIQALNTRAAITVA